MNPMIVHDVPAYRVADTAPIFPYALEGDALAHWDFDETEGSLVDRLNGHPLDPVGAVTRRDTHILIPDGERAGLLMPWPDAPDMTIAMIIEMRDLEDGTSAVLWGNAHATSASGGTFSQMTAHAFDARNSYNLRRPSLPTMTVSDYSQSPGAKMFLGFSIDGQGNRVIAFGDAEPATQTDGSAQTLGELPVALGGAHWAFGLSSLVGFRLYEAIRWNRALSAEELQGVAARSRRRMRRKGVLVA